MTKYFFDINRKDSQFTVEGLHFGDNGLRELEFCFLEKGKIFTIPEGSIATLYAILPNEAIIYDSCIIDDNSAIYVLKGGTEEPSLTAMPGKCHCEIRIISENGDVITSPAFTVTVEDTIQDDSAIEAQDSFTALTEALKRVIETEQKVAGALEAASEAQNLAQNALGEAREAQANAESALEEASDAQNLAQNTLSEAREAQANAESALEEAKESAGKVEGALERIENAETGLGSKIAKVYGTKGNIAVLGENGGIADGGMKPSKVYVVPYYSPSTITEAQKEEIRGIVTEIAADKGDYALFMRVDAKVIPASFVVDRYKRVRSTYHGNDSVSYEISVSVAGAVTTSEEKVYVTDYDVGYIERSTGKPAAAAVMAAYVQDYVAQHGNGVSDEVIAEAIEAYLKENPITFTESDPTVPSWAKASSKPSYSKSEVGLGNVDNVKQYSASNPPPYPVKSVNGKTGAVSLTASDVKALPDTYTPPDQTAEQVGADAKGTAASAVSTHNTSNASHNDIRLLIESLTTRLNALADSDDTTLDQMSEVVAYIKANKALIDSITTGKVSVTDIVDNLTTNAQNKPLSAAQGVALKALIDAITVPTKVSAFDNDKGYITDTELNSAVDDALTESKESGEFDGATGQRGTGILNTTTGIASYTTTTNGVKPTYRILLSTLKTQAKVNEVLVGDSVRYSTFLYPVITLDADYAYLGSRTSIQGTAGNNGVGISKVEQTTTSTEDGGTNVITVTKTDNTSSTFNVKNGSKGDKGDPYTLTSADKTSIANTVKSSLPTLTMVGTDASGVEHTWTIYGS